MQRAENSAALNVRLLGRTELTFAGQPVTDGTGKPLPAKLVKLLCYLAVRKRAVDRREILELLWAGKDPANVRNALKLLRTSTGAEHWLSESDAISVTASTDLDEFARAVRSRQYLDALRIWSNAELDPEQYVMGGNSDVFQEDAAFADWLGEVRAEACADYQAALYGAVLQLESQGNYPEALRLARRLLAADVLDDEANYRVMQLHYHLGAYRDVLSHFENLRRTLEMEGLPAPAPGLTALKNQAELALAARNTRYQRHLKSLLTRERQFSTPFVGREREISQLSELLSQPGTLVTLYGTGGMGKSRLAIELGKRRKHLHEDGVAFVAMDNVTKVWDGAQAILRSLGGDTAPGKASIQNLSAYLSDQNLLLILDNLTMDPDSKELLGVITQADNVSCVVTSRTPTGSPGEQLFPLRGLHYGSAGGEDRNPVDSASTHEAVELFIKCARRFNADFLVAPEDEVALASICEFVAGIPLFIEHLAAWIRVMSVQEIATELIHSNELLSAVISDFPEAHQQLEFVLDQSWKLLPEQARLPTAKLSVFRGGFTTEAAKHVAGAGLLELRAALDAAFVQRSSGDWFELHDVMRQYLSALLKANVHEHTRAQERHYDFYLHFAQKLYEGITSGAQHTWLLRFTQNRLNLEQAAAWASSKETNQWISFISNLGTGLVEYGYEAQALAHFEKILSKDLEDSRPLVEILTKSMYVRLARNELAPAAELLARAKKVSQRLKDSEAELFYLAAAAAMALQLRNAEEAKPLLQDALKLARRIPKNRTAETKIMTNMGLAHSYSGDPDKALQWYHQALTRAKNTNDVRSEGVVAGNLAIIHHLRGDYNEAHELYDASIQAKRKSGDKLGLMLSLSNLGSLLHRRNHAEAAREAWEETLSLAEAAGNISQKARSLENLGRAAYVQSELSRARVLFEQALALHRQAQRDVGIVNSLSNLALVEDSLTRRRALLDESLQLARVLQERQGFDIAGLLQLCAELAEAEKNFPEALDQLTEAAGLVIAGGNPEPIAYLASSVGCLASSLGDYETALEVLDAADGIYAELGITREPANQQRVDSRRKHAQDNLRDRPSADSENPMENASVADVIQDCLTRLRQQITTANA